MDDVLDLLSALQRAACARARIDIGVLVPQLNTISRLCATLRGRSLTGAQSLRIGEAAARLARWPEMAAYINEVESLLDGSALSEAA